MHVIIVHDKGPNLLPPGRYEILNNGIRGDTVRDQLHVTIECIRTNETLEREGQMGYYNESHANEFEYHGTSYARRRPHLDRAAIIDHQISSLMAEKYRLSQFGSDNFDDGTVILFEKTFTRDVEKVYSYAAIKARGLWFTTGPRSPKAYTWDELVDWFTKEGDVSNLRIVKKTTKWEDR